MAEQWKAALPCISTESKLFSPTSSAGEDLNPGLVSHARARKRVSSSSPSPQNMWSLTVSRSSSTQLFPVPRPCMPCCRSRLPAGTKHSLFLLSSRAIHNESILVIASHKVVRATPAIPSLYVFDIQTSRSRIICVMQSNGLVYSGGEKSKGIENCFPFLNCFFENRGSD